ncbi:MAG: hypothetical protein J7J42_01785 [Thermoplasmata archaeon]|nr:hypothetical protein [Thermoplasmata archaeon]
MKEDTKKFLRAFFEVYKEFSDLYVETSGGWSDNESFSELFQTAWNDSILGEMLREEVLERYRQLMHAEQVKKEIQEEAEAGEAMII